MKIRNGFVSNSSSSSFCIFGVNLTEAEYKKLIKNAIDECKALEAKKPKPTPIPSCKHKFDRETLKFCGICGLAAYEPFPPEDEIDEDDYDSTELLDDCEFVTKNKLSVMNTGGDGEVEICIGLDLGGSDLKGEKLIEEITRVNNILKDAYPRKAEVFSGEIYN